MTKYDKSEIRQKQEVRVVCLGHGCCCWPAKRSGSEDVDVDVVQASVVEKKVKGGDGKTVEED